MRVETSQVAKPSGSTEGLTDRAMLPGRRARNTLDEISDARDKLEVARHQLEHQVDRAWKLLRADEGVVGRETEAAAPEIAEDLTAEEWLQAELIVLAREAKARADALDATRDVVEARCHLLLAGDGR